MTKINKMVLHGFKSFAKRTELLFGERFNCILGPNGSGKSNIGDALCFVLGRSSAKALRAEKSSNLIYNGGKAKKPASFGEVSIHFDNSKKSFPVEDQEIKVTRIVKQSGQSAYKINDKIKTRNEIVELLSAAKINPDGYNIVLQGDIIRFVEMSAIERRQIIEEISGMGVYEEKKEKALKELDRVDEYLKEAEIILAERNTYLKELKKERDHAMKYKELSDKVNTNKASYLHLKIQKHEKAKQKLQDEIAESKKKLEKLQAEADEQKKQIEEKKNSITQITNEIEQKGEKEQVSMQKEIEKLKVDVATQKTKIDTYKNEIVKVKQRKQQLLSDLKDNEENIAKLTREKDALAKDVHKKNSEMQLVEQQLKKFKEKRGIDAATDIDKQIEDLDKLSDEKQKEITQLREQQQNMLREKDKCEFQLNNIEEQIKKVKEVEKDNAEQITELKNKKSLFKNTILDLNSVLTKDSELAASLGDARRRLLASQEEHSKLNARSMVVKESSMQNIAVKKILECKSKNTIRGIHGLVSDLGKVNAKYSLALEVAAGNRIQSIVVDDDKVAADCIKYLKNNRLGTASFIPLNKIKTPEMNAEIKKILKAEGVHDLCTNLVKYEPQYKNVFLHVFGDTIVVNNIDVARRIGIGNARMSTIDGDLCENTGVMRGGFREKKHGIGFKEENLDKDIEHCESLIEDLQTKISRQEKEREMNEKEISKFRGLKANLEGDIITMEKTLHLEESDLTVSSELKQNLKNKIKQSDSEMQKLMQKISDANKELANCKIKRQELRDKITSLRNPTILAELNSYEQKKQQLRDGITHTNAEIKNMDAQLGMISAERDKISAILKQHDKEIEIFNADNDVLVKAIKKGEEQLKQKEQAQKEFHTKFKGLFSKRSTLSEEINKLENKIESVREVHRDNELKTNTVQLEHAKVAAELAGLNQELSQYQGVKLDASKTEEAFKHEIDKFEKMVSNMDAVNLKALEIYDTVEREYNSLLEKKDKLGSEKDSVLKMIAEIEERKKDIFMNTFNVLNNNFKQIFSTLSTKGEASLIIENPKNIFEAGVRILVRLTGAKFLDIRSLSGGEKTLTALAFIFSIQEHDPHSFYILDEVDAALDKNNSEKLSKLIRQYVSKAQYLVISHNDSLISEADILYGVSMNEHGVSNVASLKL
ncbi:chromosome segregation protein SMC [Candidatus Woesearchaeota archaeon]|nr:chromosome segregation protein SMC [Candidatus Woesearchaeota archaeon]